MMDRESDRCLTDLNRKIKLSSGNGRNEEEAIFLSGQELSMNVFHYGPKKSNHTRDNDHSRF